MSYRIKYMDEAKLDIKEITLYLAQFYASTVRSFGLKLKKQVCMLVDMPYMYPIYEDAPFFRRMVLGDYLLFYSVDEALGLVVIHRIFHHSRNISRKLLSDRL